MRCDCKCHDNKKWIRISTRREDESAADFKRKFIGNACFSNKKHDWDYSLTCCPGCMRCKICGLTVYMPLPKKGRPTIRFSVAERKKFNFYE